MVLRDVLLHDAEALRLQALRLHALRLQALRLQARLSAAWTGMKGRVFATHRFGLGDAALWW